MFWYGLCTDVLYVLVSTCCIDVWSATHVPMYVLLDAVDSTDVATATPLLMYDVVTVVLMYMHVLPCSHADRVSNLLHCIYLYIVCRHGLTLTSL